MRHAFSPLPVFQKEKISYKMPENHIIHYEAFFTLFMLFFSFFFVLALHSVEFCLEVSLIFFESKIVLQQIDDNDTYVYGHERIEGGKK